MTKTRATKQQTPTQTTKHSPSDKTAEQLPFIEHIYELRNRLFFVALVLLLASSLAFVFNKELVNFILAPMGDQKLIFLTVGGGFSFIFTVCIYFGIIMTIPTIVFHLYKFIRPVMSKPSRKLIVGVVFGSTFLAIAGAAFGYYVAIQASLDFLLGFASGAITSSVTAESYLNFVVMYTAGLAAVFQLPLLLFIFDHVKPFPPGRLLSSQRFVIAGAVIVAALITPTPDIVNQMIIAVPVIVIYQIGVFAVWLRHRKERKAAKLAAKRQRVSAPAYAAPPVLAATPTPVKQPVISDELLSNIFFEDAPTPRLSPSESPLKPTAQQTAPLHKGPRAVDGFARRPVRPQAVAVPSRSLVQEAPTRPQIVRPSGMQRRSNRSISIDGFSMV